MLPLLCLALAASCGDPERDFFGVAIAAAGDVNGDGTPDLWVADPRRERNETSDSGGRVWLVDGATRRGLRNVPAPDGASGFGWTLESLPDVDGDGTDELAVGALFFASEDFRLPGQHEADGVPIGDGGVFVFSGASGALLHTWRGPHDALKELWHSTGAGPALAAVGDWDGDGRCDLAIGWSLASDDGPLRGCVRVVATGDGDVIREFSGDEACDRFGYALAALGDPRVAGPRALVVSALPEFTPGIHGAHENLGRVRPAYVRALEPSGAVRFEARCPARCSRFGSSLAWIPAALAEEGRIAVSECFCYVHESVVRVLDPESGETLRTLHAPWSPGETHDHDEAFRFDLPFGVRVLALGDLDLDGVRELVVTDPGADSGHHATILSGADGHARHRTNLGSPPSSVLDGWPLRVGNSAAHAGDTNGDGSEDIWLGGASVRGGSGGVVVLVSGADGSTLRWYSRSML